MTLIYTQATANRSFVHSKIFTEEIRQDPSQVLYQVRVNNHFIVDAPLTTLPKKKTQVLQEKFLTVSNNSNLTFMNLTNLEVSNNSNWTFTYQENGNIRDR